MISVSRKVHLQISEIATIPVIFYLMSTFDLNLDRRVSANSSNSNNFFLDTKPQHLTNPKQFS